MAVDLADEEGDDLVQQGHAVFIDVMRQEFATTPVPPLRFSGRAKGNLEKASVISAKAATKALLYVGTYGSCTANDLVNDSPTPTFFLPIATIRSNQIVKEQGLAISIEFPDWPRLNLWRHLFLPLSISHRHPPPPSARYSSFAICYLLFADSPVLERSVRAALDPAGRGKRTEYRRTTRRPVSARSRSECPTVR